MSEQAAREKTYEEIASEIVGFETLQPHIVVQAIQIGHMRGVREGREEKAEEIRRLQSENERMGELLDQISQNIRDQWK